VLATPTDRSGLKWAWSRVQLSAANVSYGSNSEILAASTCFPLCPQQQTLFRSVVKASEFDPEKFEDHYEEAPTELINAKRNGRTIAANLDPRGENVVVLMDAPKKSISSEAAPEGKKPQKASAGQKEMLLPIEGKKPAKKAAKAERIAKRKAG
jgi:hypothetical protein